MTEAGYRNAVIGCDETAQLTIWYDENDRPWYRVKGMGWDGPPRRTLEEAWLAGFDFMAKIVGDVNSAYTKPHPEGWDG